jgi:hypothetical protein
MLSARLSSKDTIMKNNTRCAAMALAMTVGMMLAHPASAQGLGSGKEGEGQHNSTGQGGGGVGASGSGPQGSGAEGDSHAPAGKDPATKSNTNGDDKKADPDAVTNKDVQRLYTPPPQDRAAPANAEKPAR